MSHPKIHRFLLRTVALLGMGAVFTLVSPATRVTAQLIGIDDVLPTESERRNIHLACFLEQTQNELNEELSPQNHYFVAWQLLEIADEYYQGGELARSKAALEQALPMTENLQNLWQRIDLLELIAKQYRQLNLLDESRTALEQAAIATRQLEESDSLENLSKINALTRIAALYHELGEPNETLKLLAEAQQLAESDADGYTGGLTAVAVGYIQVGDYDRADALFSQTLQGPPRYVDPVMSRIEINREAIREYVRVGASDRIQRLLAREQEAFIQASLLSFAAEQYSLAGQPEQSLIALDQLTQLAETLPVGQRDVIVLQIANRYVELGQPEAALPIVESVDTWFEPALPQALQAYLYAASGKTDEAFDILQAQVDQSGEWSEDYNGWFGGSAFNILDLYIEQNQTDHIQRMLALEPFQNNLRDRIEVNAKLTLAHFRAGRYTEAEQVLTELLEQTHPEDHYPLNGYLPQIFAELIKAGRYEQVNQLMQRFPEAIEGSYWQPRLDCFRSRLGSV